jgi:hypothetical protein
MRGGREIRYILLAELARGSARALSEIRDGKLLNISTRIRH